MEFGWFGLVGLGKVGDLVDCSTVVGSLGWCVELCGRGTKLELWSSSEQRLWCLVV